MKGFGVIVLFAFLVLISLGLMVASTALFGKKSAIGENEIRIKGHVYIMRDSLDVAHSVYVAESLHYSVYQAMHDNGLKGGWMELTDSNRIEYNGDDYALWYDNEDLSPSDEDVASSLRGSAEKNLNEYAKVGAVSTPLVVSLPEYGIEISEFNDFSFVVNATPDSKLSVQRKTEEADLELKKDADIAERLHIPYFLLFKKARGYHADVIAGIEGCSIEDFEEADWLYSASVERLESDEEHCLVKVVLATRKRFPVWNGTGTVLDEIRLVFLERFTKTEETAGEGE